MNIKEIKASKAQGHKRAEDVKNNNRKVNKETKKRVHLKLFIDGHLLAAGALLAPSGTARSS